MRRHLVFFALIVLMALRGLVGPAMAAQMAGVPHGGSAPSVQTEHADHAAHAQHPTAHAGHAPSPDPIATTANCHGESAGTASPLPACGAAGGTHAAHAACADCEICHTVVMAPPAPALGAASHGAGPRVPAAVRFASALPAQATKPPIS